MLVKLEQVKFKSDFVEMVVVAGKDAIAKLGHRYWVSVRKVCENLGLNYATQYKKLKAEADSYEAKFIDVKTNGGVQKVFCIPLSKLNGWLFTINPNKVKPETKEKLIAYKKEAFEVLYSHFVKEAKKVTQKNLLGETNDKFIEELVKRTDIVRGYQGQIKALENQIAKQNDIINNYKRLLSEDGDLYFQALEHFITKIDKMQEELEAFKINFINKFQEELNSIKLILSTEPKKLNDHIKWGKTLFPRNKYDKQRLKSLL